MANFQPPDLCGASQLPVGASGCIQATTDYQDLGTHRQVRRRSRWSAYSPHPFSLYKASQYLRASPLLPSEEQNLRAQGQQAQEQGLNRWEQAPLPQSGSQGHWNGRGCQVSNESWWAQAECSSNVEPAKGSRLPTQDQPCGSFLPIRAQFGPVLGGTSDMRTQLYTCLSHTPSNTGPELNPGYGRITGLWRGFSLEHCGAHRIWH